MTVSVPTAEEFQALENILASLTVRVDKLETQTPPPPPPPPVTGVDRFGIKKIYPDAPSPKNKEWAVNMDNPSSTANFKNLPTITKQGDGSFQTSASQVRMEAWSPVGNKWQNVEITAYNKWLSGTPQYNYIWQMYRGGGHHSANTTSQKCWGAAYKVAMLSKDTCSTQCRKEINHPAYCNDRATTKTSTKPLLNRWIGMKQVTYQYLKNGKTFVRMEVWVDDDVTDANGNLVIKNDWKLFSNTNDEGGWTVESGRMATDFNPSCPPLNKDSTQQFRQPDEILNMPGQCNDTAVNQNLCAWRTDDVTNNWKYLSVREITPGTGGSV
jgi:hypothetical protein